MDLIRQKVIDVIEIERGGIFDRFGREIALSIQTPSAFIMTKKSKGKQVLLNAFSGLSWVNIKDIREAFEKDKGFVWIKRKLTPGQKKYLDKLDFKEIDCVMESERFYPNAELGGQIIGFVGTDGKGLEGLEFYFDQLMDQYTEISEGESALSDLNPYYLYGRRECNLFLTIDLAVQYFSEEILKNACKNVGAEHGILIIMDTYTGEILSLANYPGYNPNHFAKYPCSYWRNRCVTDIYEPGSIFKIFWAAALLEEKMIQSDTLIYCENGSMNVAGKKIRDHKKFGWLSFKQVLERSSNIGAIKCAQKLGEKRLYQYIKNFGFGERTEIDFPGEVIGILRPPRKWSGLSLASIAIGQEISVTPIQMVTAFSALLNGGDLMRPYIVKEIRNSQGKIIFEQKPVIKRKVISNETSQEIKEILRGVVKRGTGIKADVPGYIIGGKTGTAQMIDKSTGEYSHENFLTSFIGFFPEYKARWAMLVMIDRPKLACWGGEVAAPIFCEVAKKVIRYFHITPVDKNSPDQNDQLTVTAKLKRNFNYKISDASY